MKRRNHTLAAIGLVSLAALFSACKNDSKSTNADATLTEKAQSAYQDAKTATANTASDLADSTKQAWNSFSEYSMEKKDQAVAFLKDQSSNIDSKIDELKASASKTSPAVKEKMNDAMAKLADKRADLAEQLDKLKNATGDTWDKVKSDTESRWKALVDYLNKIKSEYQIS